MAFNKLRELRKKEISINEVIHMISRYESECGEVKVRQATSEEKLITGRKTKQEDHNKYKKSYGWFDMRGGSNSDV